MGVVSTWVIAALRNRQFFSLAELNEAVSEKLYEFNHKPFQKKEGSRAAAFEEEKPFLLPLPAVPFELAMWKVATVQYNYHISVDKQNYSVQMNDSQYNGLSFEDRFSMLVDAEWTRRKSNRLHSLIRAAGYAAPSACVEDIS